MNSLEIKIVSNFYAEDLKKIFSYLEEKFEIKREEFIWTSERMENQFCGYDEKGEMMMRIIDEYKFVHNGIDSDLREKIVKSLREEFTDIKIY